MFIFIVVSLGANVNRTTEEAQETACNLKEIDNEMNYPLISF